MQSLEGLLDLGIGKMAVLYHQTGRFIRNTRAVVVFTALHENCRRIVDGAVLAMSKRVKEGGADSWNVMLDISEELAINTLFANRLIEHTATKTCGHANV